MTPSVSYRLAIDDYVAVCTYLQARSHKSRAVGGSVFLLMVGMYVALSVLVPDRLSLLAGVLSTVAVVFVVARILKRRTLQGLAADYVLSEYQVQLTPSAIRVSTPHWEGWAKWSALKEVGKSERHLFLRFDDTAAYAIPKTAFASPEQLSEFVRYAEAARDDAEQEPAVAACD